MTLSVRVIVTDDEQAMQTEYHLRKGCRYEVTQTYQQPIGDRDFMRRTPRSTILLSGEIETTISVSTKHTAAERLYRADEIAWAIKSALKMIAWSDHRYGWWYRNVVKGIADVLGITIEGTS